MPYRTYKMLVVDDFATMARIMKTLAQRIGFTDIDVCHDGASALRMLRARHHEFILCDIRMAPMDGVEFASRVRSDPASRDCVLLLTTADQERAAALLHAGILRVVDGLILKPFNSIELRAKLDDIAVASRKSANSTYYC
ncbi:MAG: response regulator [Pseudolabrys sp.]